VTPLNLSNKEHVQGSAASLPGRTFPPYALDPAHGLQTALISLVDLVSGLLSLSGTEYAQKENIKNVILGFKHQCKPKSILEKKKKKDSRCLSKAQGHELIDVTL
jgi:hypothetical protein